MIDQSLVVSGFDAEILLGARYVRYLLLSSVETGTFPMRVALDEPPVDITLHPPEDYQRLYEPNPGAEPLPPALADGPFETEILFNHDSGADLRVRMIVDLRDREVGDEITEQFIDLFVKLTLETETGEDGAPRDARLRFEVVDLELDGLLLFALLFAEMTPDDLLPRIKQRVDRAIDLGVVGAGQNLQAIRLRKLKRAAGHPSALAVYLNLRLRDGPEPDSYLDDRGDPDQGRNFLPAGDDLAFGIPGSLYARLGDDVMFRMAEETAAGSGEYHYPIRERPGDPTSPQKGKIWSITIRPLAGNVLEASVRGEFFVDVIPDPHFQFTFTITPKVEDGLLTFSVTHDIDVDLLGALLIGIVIVGVVLGLGSGGLTALLILGVQELIVEPILMQATGQLGGAVDASFLDALPHRVGAERRRWDPFYVTEHQIVALLDGVQINDAGIGFSGKAVLDKEPDPVGHVVIRDEARDATDAVTELWYRVLDFDFVAGDFTPVFPATDRLPFARVEGDPEPNLVRLTLSQVRDRLGGTRLRERIAYVPKKVYVRENQVRRLMCISETEIGEAHWRLISEFRDATRAEILAEQGDELRQSLAEALEEELGQPPTDEQLQERLDARLAELVAEREGPFVADELPERLDGAVEALLRLDLDSPELFALEDDRALFLRGFERIRMRRGGQVSEYYRDRPDFDPRDNLLSLPRYTPAGV